VVLSDIYPDLLMISFLDYVYKTYLYFSVACFINLFLLLKIYI